MALYRLWSGRPCATAEYLSSAATRYAGRAKYLVAEAAAAGPPRRIVLHKEHTHLGQGRGLQVSPEAGVTARLCQWQPRYFGPMGGLFWSRSKAAISAICVSLVLGCDWWGAASLSQVLRGAFLSLRI